MNIILPKKHQKKNRETKSLANKDESPHSDILNA